MSETWSDLPYTGLPEQMSKAIVKHDITSEALPQLLQYQSYLETGTASGLMLAKQYLLEHPIILESLITADDILKLSQDNIALQRLFFNDIEKYIMSVVSPQGEYDESRAYDRYNIVFYKNQAYFCYKKTEAGILPTNTEYFYPITLKGEQGNPGVNFVAMGEWNEYFTYSANHAVSWNGALWYSISDFNSGNEPNDLSIHWNKFFILSQNASDVNLDSGDNVQNKIDSIENNIVNIENNSATKEELINLEEIVSSSTEILKGASIPTENTVGKLGQHYKDTSDGGRLYICIDIIANQETGETRYIWNKVVNDNDTPELWKKATSQGTSGYPDINTVDKRCFVIDVGDSNILKYYDSESSSWKPITSVWS